MTKRRNAKFVVFSAAICLILCCTLVLGDTYAWFTDNVTSEGNIIASGNLDVEMIWSDDGQNWKDASTGKIFDHKLWEPGYTAVRYIKIKNAGNLAFKFALTLESDEEANADGIKLSEVIDVYMGTGAGNRNDVTNMTYVGTLAELMADADGAAYGQLLAGQELDQCIVLKMQESAGNEYKNLSIGSGISVKLDATQLTHEEDSFGSDYDENSGKPVAAIYRNPANENTPIDWIGYGIWQADGDYANHPLEAAYVFAATEEDIANNPYKDWFCDFYVSLDRDLTENQLFLGGAYGGFLVGFNVDNDILSIGYPETNTLPKNTTIPLLGSVTGGASNWTYEAIVNDVQEFGCGVADINNALVGATFTVELRLINPEDVNDMITVSKVEYTFTEGVNTPALLATELAAGGEVKLTADLDLAGTQISIPAGVTATLDLNGYDIIADTTANETTATYGMINVAPGATLNVTGNGNVVLKTNVTKGVSACIFQNDGVLNISGGYYEANQANSVAGLGAIIAVIDNAPYASDATVNITGGTFAVTGKGASNIIRNWPISSGTATVNISGGKFVANPERTTSYIWNKNDTNLGAALAKIVVTGGEFVGNVVCEIDGYENSAQIASGVNLPIVEGSITGFVPAP